jgi:outer membrane PBP1 activator LpoA protein
VQHNFQPSVLLRGLAAVSLLALLLTGACTTAPVGTGPVSADRAERLQKQGSFTAAAQMYERLAAQNPAPDNLNFALAAAHAWLAGNRPDDAQRTLDAFTAGGTPAQQFERELLRAETATARGQYAAAWRDLAAVAEPASPAEATRLFRLRQDVALRAGQPLEAVRAGIARERIATTDAARNSARRDLLTDLRGAIDRGLRIDPAAAREPLVRGWLEMGQIAAAAGRSPMGAEAALDRWRARFPGHPAATIAYSEIVAPGARATASAAPIASGSIALLLPLSGTNAATAELVRDGFLAAISRQPEGNRPAVRVYDTGTLTVAAALQSAQSEGAGFIVGPLTREQAQQAAEQRPGVLPLLLLNNLGTDAFPGVQLFQYALAPEDEARQIARQLNAAGQHRAVVLSPTGERGARVATAFADELVRGGGRVVAQGNFDLARNDISTVITGSLGVDAARARQRRLQQITGLTLEYIPKPRADLDAIFVAASQALALRQINSLLRFFGAEGVPTYITQDGVDPDEPGNRDLEGMRFVDLPWMLEPTGPVADTRAATESAWSARGKRQSRYFAFGYDAATLALALRSGQNTWPVAGMTGRLALTPEGRIERSLDWARFKNGAPELYDPLR